MDRRASVVKISAFRCSSYFSFQQIKIDRHAHGEEAVATTLQMEWRRRMLGCFLLPMRKRAIVY
jgi:hypothetical protein